MKEIFMLIAKCKSCNVKRKGMLLYLGCDSSDLPLMLLCFLLISG